MDRWRKRKKKKENKWGKEWRRARKGRENVDKGGKKRREEWEGWGVSRGMRYEEEPSNMKGEEKVQKRIYFHYLVGHNFLSSNMRKKKKNENVDYFAFLTRFSSSVIWI